MSKEIPLTNGGVTIVSDCDYKWLSQWKWRFDGHYATRSSGSRTVMMHKEILRRSGLKGCFQGDHHDTIKLNNRRSNLRPATHQQNMQNFPRRKDSTSGFKGVHWDNKAGKWRMQIQLGSKRIRKFFCDVMEAAKAYDILALKHFGEFARTNFPMRFPRSKI